jgi:hypothetical protein
MVVYVRGTKKSFFGFSRGEISSAAPTIVQHGSLLKKAYVKSKLQPSIWHILLCHCLMEMVFPLRFNLNQVEKIQNK